MTRSRFHLNVWFLGCVCFMGLILFSGCSQDQDPLLTQLAELEEGEYKGQKLSDMSLEELQKELVFIEKEVERILVVGERLGTLYKTVALRFMDREMYGLAADYFRKALDVYPTNHVIAYKAGLCLSQLAQSHAEQEKKTDLFRQSEGYYLNAIRADAKYIDALYALSILYIFELDRSGEALPYLERIIQNQSRQYRAMFLLARIYVELGRTDEAAGLYQDIIDGSKDKEEVEQARENKRLISGP